MSSLPLGSVLPEILPLAQAMSPWAAIARRTGHRLRRAGHRSAALLLLVGLWELAPRAGWSDATFLPPVSEVLLAGLDLARSGQLWEHASASLARTLAGFLIALLLAVPLGLAIGWQARVGDTFNALIEVLRNTAPLALLPVFILFLGIGELSKVTLVVYSCAWPLLLNTIAGVRQVDPLLVKSARTLGATPLQLFVKVIVPAALPTLFVGVRLASASSVLVLIAAEMVGAKAGLGFLVTASQFSFQIPQMYFGILTITAIGLGYNAALAALERRCTRWRGAAATAGLGA